MTEERSSLSFYHQQYYEDSLAMVFYYEHVQRPKLYPSNGVLL